MYKVEKGNEVDTTENSQEPEVVVNVANADYIIHPRAFPMFTCNFWGHSN